MPSLMRSSSNALGVSAASSPFGAVASQAAAVNAFRSRLRSPSPASSVADTEEDLDLQSAMLPPLPPQAAAGVHASLHPHGHSACDSCSELETEFAAAVLFVETYNGASTALLGFSVCVSRILCFLCVVTDGNAVKRLSPEHKGPHRVLTQENSTPKKEFYAFYQQATAGPCPSATPPLGLSKVETSKW